MVGFGAWRGWKDGLLSASANLLGLVISLVMAFSLYASTAKWLLHIWVLPTGLANIFAFFLLAVVIDGLVSMLILMAAAYVHPKWGKATWWKALGIGPGLLNSLIMAGYLSSLVLSLPIDHPIKVAVRDSHLGPAAAGLVQRVGAPTDQLVQPALADLSQLFTVEPGSKDFVTLPFKVADPQICAEAEASMLVLVNQERSQRGIAIVKADEPLRTVGRAHSLDMFQRGYFSHYTPEGKDPFDRMDAAGIHYQAAGENLALAPTLQAAHTGLMNSPGHKRNILDPHFHKLGIGCYQSKQYGMMFSQEFSN
jgi:uncharacterized protein YkwD